MRWWRRGRAVEAPTAEPGPAEMVERMLADARAGLQEGRHVSTLAAARRAIVVAREAGTVGAVIRALSVEAEAHRMLGGCQEAQGCYTRILALADDATPVSGAPPLDEQALGDVYLAHLGRVECARALGGSTLAALFDQLAATERWLQRIGRPHWRAGVVRQRALLHEARSGPRSAIPAARRALDTARANPGAPGYVLAEFYSTLGELLIASGHAAHAEAPFRAALEVRDGHEPARVRAQVGLARCLRDGDAALALAREAATTAELHGGHGHVYALTTLYLRQTGTQDHPAAESTATKLLAAARQVGDRQHTVRAYEWLVDQALHRADVPAARALLDAFAADDTLDAPVGSGSVRDPVRGKRMQVDNVERVGGGRAAGRRDRGGGPVDAEGNPVDAPR